MNKEIELLVKRFGDHVRAWASAENSRTANKHATLFVAAFKDLRSYGDRGRDELKALFKDPSPDVRTQAAAFLLRHCNAEATKVLRDVANGKGMVALSAEQALERWKEGTWSLDPDDNGGGPDRPRKARDRRGSRTS
jgi:hypothetical protein